MRIVAGKFADRKLMSPQDDRVHPTAEHVRVAMMELLRDDIEKARVLDLFAGTGALGLEALSRGARYVDFVETRPSSLHALRANVAALRLREVSRIFRKDALPFAAALKDDAFDVAFADPPYESKMLDRLIDTWVALKFARVLIVEHAAGHTLPRPVKQRTLEKTIISVYRV